MASVKEFLIKPDDELVLLFTPPFNNTSSDPGYIRGYLPGVRENGGQYSHAAIWCIIAYASLDKAQSAIELFSMLNPVNHTSTPAGMRKYKVEPYVMAADVYSETPYVGRGGWTWYTGSSSWMYRAGIESLLGFNLKGNTLELDPHISAEWKSYAIRYRHGKSHYSIEVRNPKNLSSGSKKIIIDLIDDGADHQVIVDLI
jgi:cyclic beta-1,2-glucan synthetase